MKNLFYSALRCNRESFAVQPILYGPFKNVASLFGLFLLSFLLITGCRKANVNTPADEVHGLESHAAQDAQIINEYSGLSGQTLWELQQARAATARYRHIENAIKDGYTDINVVVQNMGFHYMKSTLVDANFDIRNPEILVYNKDEQGRVQLVAVEYAVPISLSPVLAPEGFTGSQDVWDRNTGFGLWLLHAWVWSYNPEGVFNPTNSLVHLH